MSGSRTPTFIPYAGVICRQHGQVDIDKRAYDFQMDNPGLRWKCPICGLFVEFNDERYEQLHPNED